MNTTNDRIKLTLGGQAALRPDCCTALTALYTARSTYLFLTVNFGSKTKKACQFFLDWRAKQKPSRRAGFVTAIKDSPG